MIVVDETLREIVAPIWLKVSGGFSGIKIRYVAPNEILGAVFRLHPLILVLNTESENFPENVDAIRKALGFNGAFILAATTTSNHTPTSQILDLGVDDVFHYTKDDSEVLKAKFSRMLTKALGPTPLNRPISVQVGTITILPEKLVVVYENRLISLAPMEFRLLMLLADKHNQTVTTSYLIDSLWGGYGKSYNLRVLIHLLRKKLKDDMKPFRLIRSSAQGYSLIS